MAKTSVKFQNDWPKTVGGVALTSQLLTNWHTDERTDHGTPIWHLRANAGATKTWQNWFFYVHMHLLLERRKLRACIYARKPDRLHSKNSLSLNRFSYWTVIWIFIISTINHFSLNRKGWLGKIPWPGQLAPRGWRYPGLGSLPPASRKPYTT